MADKKKTISAEYLRPNSAFRPPNWRWERARLLRNDPRIGSIFRGEDDDWVRKVKRYQIEVEECRDTYDELMLNKRWPALREAWMLYNQESPQLNRFEVEARLLAEDPFEKIADRARLSVNGVIWYEKIFFNVLDRLKHKGYICHQVLGENLHYGMTERDLQLLWQMAGYFGKGVAVDVFTARHYDVTPAENEGQFQDYAGDDYTQSSFLKTMIAMRTMPINSYTQQIIVEIHQNFLQLKAAAEGQRGTGDMNSSNVGVMLETMSWTMGRQRVLVAANDPKRIVGRLPSEIARVDELGQELRADELLRLSTGIQDRPRELAARFPKEENKDVPTAAQ